MVKYAYYGKEHFFSEISPSQSYSLSLIAQLVKNLPAMREGGLGSVTGSGGSPGGGHGNPLQYSCLENPHGQRSLAGYSAWSHKVTQH